MKTKMIDDKVLPIPMLGKELGRFEGATFYIAEHEYGILFHVYNSMDFIVRPGKTSCYETLSDLVRNKDVYEKLEGSEKEVFDLNLSAITYILTSPLYVFSNVEFTYEIAACIVKNLEKCIEDSVENAKLQEETPEENKTFKDAMDGLETIKRILKDEGDGQ